MSNVYPNELYKKRTIKFIHQKEHTGTADAIALSKDFVGYDGFIVLAGDTIFDSKDLKK